jgi:hypothetical protein
MSASSVTATAAALRGGRSSSASSLSGSWQILEAPVITESARPASGKPPAHRVDAKDIMAAALGRGAQPAAGSLETRSADLEPARAKESAHEIVALSDGKLVVNWGNYNRFKEHSDSDIPTLVVSFLGNTTMGKSTLIKALIGDGDDVPFVPDRQSSSATFNVNLYTSRRTLRLTDGTYREFEVKFLDFEGEAGSAEPMMAHAYQPGGGHGDNKRRGSSDVSSSAATAGSDTATSASGNNKLPLMLQGLYSSLAKPSTLASTAGLTVASPFPVVSSNGGGGTGSGSILERSRQVSEHFPRLAYCISDLVVLVGADTLFSSAYLERALTFARAANNNIQDVRLPALILVQNKLPGDEIEYDWEETTRKWNASMGRDAQALDGYFSTTMAIQIPNKKWPAGPGHRSGAEGFEYQISKLRATLSGVLDAKVMEAQVQEAMGMTAEATNGPLSPSDKSKTSRHAVLTSRQGLWYLMLPRVVNRLNSGGSVHVNRLMDEAWAEMLAGLLGPGSGSSKSGSSGSAKKGGLWDEFKMFATYLRPHPKHSTTPEEGLVCEDVLARFDRYHALVLDVSVRLIAAKLRSNPETRHFPEKIRNDVAKWLQGVVQMLDELSPCCAVDGEGHTGPKHELGTPAGPGSDTTILCLQEKRGHKKGHRGCKIVKGGGTAFWQRLKNSLTPYNPVWPGDFKPAPKFRSNKSIYDLQDEVAYLAQIDDDYTFYGDELKSLQNSHSKDNVRISFALIASSSSSSTTTATAAAMPSASSSSRDPLRLSASPLSDPAMPYCCGCSCLARHHSKNGGSSKKEDGVSNGSGAAADDGMVSAASAEARAGGILATLKAVGEFVTSEFLPGAGAARSAAGSTSKPAAAGMRELRVTVRNEQQIVLGLCKRCWANACRYNEDHRGGTAGEETETE